jgi:hypothetical protein
VGDMPRREFQKIIQKPGVRRYVLAGGLVALSAYVSYQAYRSNAYSRGKGYLTRLAHGISRYLEAFTTGGEIVKGLLHDIETFLGSSTDEIPQSLRQLSKLVLSEEFTAATERAVGSIYRGISGIAKIENEDGARNANGPNVVDKILDALLSDRGHSLVSVAVTMGTRNLVNAYMESSARWGGGVVGGEMIKSTEGDREKDGPLDKLIAFFSSNRGQQLAVMSISAFASHGMQVYMDKSLEVNMYEDLFSSMSKPEHMKAVKDCVAVFARAAVSAYLGKNDQNSSSSGANEQQQSGVETSDRSSNYVCGTMDVLPKEQISPESEEKAFLASSETPRSQTTAIDDLDSDSLLHAEKQVDKIKVGLIGVMNTDKRYRGLGKGGWVGAVGKEWLKATAIPEGRRAIVDVVGTATREVASGISTVFFDNYGTFVLLMLVIFSALGTAMLISLVSKLSLGSGHMM